MVVVVIAVVVVAVTPAFDEFNIKGPVEPAGTLYLDMEFVADEYADIVRVAFCVDGNKRPVPLMLVVVVVVVAVVNEVDNLVGEPSICKIFD